MVGKCLYQNSHAKMRFGVIYGCVLLSSVVCVGLWCTPTDIHHHMCFYALTALCAPSFTSQFTVQDISLLLSILQLLKHRFPPISLLSSLLYTPHINGVSAVEALLFLSYIITGGKKISFHVSTTVSAPLTAHLSPISTCLWSFFCMGQIWFRNPAKILLSKWSIYYFGRWKNNLGRWIFFIYLSPWALRLWN